MRKHAQSKYVFSPLLRAGFCILTNLLNWFWYNFLLLPFYFLLDNPAAVQSRVNIRLIKSEPFIRTWRFKNAVVNFGVKFL
jgi:hypothetical protein